MKIFLSFMLLNLCFWLLSLIMVLISVVFITLWERKVMSYIGLRKGPNKVSFVGILQPLTDRIKLLLKELGKPNISNILLFWFFPLLSSLILFFIWIIFYYEKRIIIFYLGIIGILCCASLKVYVLIGGGWGRKRKFSFLGCLRGSAQRISYEVVLIFILFFPCLLCYSYKLKKIYYKNKFLLLGWLIIFFFWLIICLAETNRSPFDFVEGERELVSGFKIEYGALQFVFLYLAEYGSIIFFSFFTGKLFFSFNTIIAKLLRIMIIFFFIWIRSTVPRFRYDLLMELSWIIILPFILLFLFRFFRKFFFI